MITRRGTLTLMATAALPRIAFAALPEPPVLADAVAAGDLPAMADRLPKNPRIIDLPALGRTLGQYGGRARMLVGGQRDIRLMPIYSYARLVGYDQQLNLVPDILADFTVEEGRIYTFTLREGHRWSDGAPFTTEDFRYVWDDLINNPDIYRGGPPVDLKAGGLFPRFEVLDALTLRYIWDHPAPNFLPVLASPAPLLLALPAHYMRQFHARYAPEASLAELCKQYRVDDWQSLHTKMGRQNRPENPDLPTLEAWRPRTSPPAEQFVFERNPFFHRADTAGRQLPYIDRVELNVSSSEIITAKTATGESDLQASGLAFNDYTLMKHAEKNYPIKVGLWRRTQGSSVALIPNLTCSDPVWRALFQDVRVRRAFSVAIDREEINKVLYYGLARESSDTILPESPLFKAEYASAWAQFDTDLANSLLDEAGLSKRDIYGTRLLPDGRKAGIVIETAGESTLETDVLALVSDHWREIGIPLYVRTSQRDIFRSRALAGEVLMGVWTGLDNGVPTADMAPTGLAPTAGDQLQWPVWGMHYITAETKGQPPDYAPAIDLLRLLRDWQNTTSTAARATIWADMLAIRADQVLTIGTVSGALQPVVWSSAMRNVPQEALYGFEPTSYLGAYLPDTFYYEGGA